MLELGEGMGCGLGWDDEGACCRGAIVKSVTHFLCSANPASPSDSGFPVKAAYGARDAKVLSFG